MTALSAAARAESKPVLVSSHLEARYGAVRVLDDISFAVDKGEILAIVGASGCGKTTLLKNLIGLIPPTAGEVLYWGRDMRRMDEDAYRATLNRVGVAFQFGGLFNSMSLGDNIAMPMRERGDMDEGTIRELVEMKLMMVGLADFQHLLPSELSGGMRKRAGFARALALDPELVFFDEPSSGLDPITAAGIDELMAKMARSFGLTMVIVTHELPSIELVADRVLMLDLGQAIFEGTIAEARESDHARVRQFFNRQADKTIAVRSAGGSGLPLPAQ
jgi:phospholipid/cholesterol/gamma-HCH transport system ATP-binding protein